MIIINFKNYKRGKEARELARTIYLYANQAIVAVSAPDIKEIADKLKNIKSITNYIQTARIGNAQILRTENSPPLIYPKDKKRVIIKIFNKNKVKNI